MSVVFTLIAIPIMVEALENPPYEKPDRKPDRKPVIEIINAEPAGKEYDIEETHPNGIHDDDGIIKKDAVINTDKVLYQINDPDGWTNMRVSPGGEIIRTIDTLERFEVIGEERNWKMVKLDNNEEGFIHNSRIIIAD